MRVIVPRQHPFDQPEQQKARDHASGNREPRLACPERFRNQVADCGAKDRARAEGGQLGKDSPQQRFLLCQKQRHEKR